MIYQFRLAEHVSGQFIDQDSALFAHAQDIIDSGLTRVTSRYGANEAGRARVDEEGRVWSYHNGIHAIDVAADALRYYLARGGQAPRTMVRLAIAGIFHDADQHSGRDNEVLSAEIMADDMAASGLFTPEEVVLSKDDVMMTQMFPGVRRMKPRTLEAEAMQAGDLSVLGQRRGVVRGVELTLELSSLCVPGDRETIALSEAFELLSAEKLQKCLLAQAAFVASYRPSETADKLWPHRGANNEWWQWAAERVVSRRMAGAELYEAAQEYSAQ